MNNMTHFKCRKLKVLYFPIVVPCTCIENNGKEL